MRPWGKDLQILPTIGFYPIHWAKVRKYFTDEDPADQHAVWVGADQLLLPGVCHWCAPGVTSTHIIWRSRHHLTCFSPS